MPVETGTGLDLMALAPLAVFVLAAAFATVAAVKRRELLAYLKRMGSA